MRLDPTDERDVGILARLVEDFDMQYGPRVGDYVRFTDGIERRISHLWTGMAEVGMEDVAQTSDGGSFHLGRDGCSFSGSLHPGTPLEQLVLTTETKLGPVWFWHHDWRGADNGVYTEIPLRIYTTELEAPR